MEIYDEGSSFLEMWNWKDNSKHSLSSSHRQGNGSGLMILRSEDELLLLKLHNKIICQMCQQQTMSPLASLSRLAEGKQHFSYTKIDRNEKSPFNIRQGHSAWTNFNLISIFFKFEASPTPNASRINQFHIIPANKWQVKDTFTFCYTIITKNPTRPVRPGQTSHRLARQPNTNIHDNNGKWMKHNISFTFTISISLFKRQQTTIWRITQKLYNIYSISRHTYHRKLPLPLSSVYVAHEKPPFCLFGEYCTPGNTLFSTVMYITNRE